jgi:peptidoglycan/LPS O-acetylase OafA/YrhL
VVSQGDLGVDLFFLLSGFVLAHNYLHRLGGSPSLRGSLGFLWLRLARVWPLYLVAVLGGGLLLWLRLVWWGSHPHAPLTWVRLVEQVLMVQQWTAGHVPDTSWTGPAWSISAEWLAYLCFPVLAVAVVRLHRRSGRPALWVAAAAVLAPILVWTTVAHTQAASYMWLARLASEFTCGMLLSAALRSDAARFRRGAAWLAPAAVVATLGWLYLAALVDRPWLGPLVVGLFPVLVVGLTAGDGVVQRWLGSRPMVLGGGLSFALYLVHVPLLKLFRDAREHGVVPLGAGQQLYGELAVAALSLVLAHQLFTRVEEPLRKRLRDLAPRTIGGRLRQDSNLRHLVPETSALSPELRRHAPAADRGRDEEDYRAILPRRKPEAVDTLAR